MEILKEQSIGELVRKAENEFVHATTQYSEHVEFSMHDTLEQIDAYLNSKHISGSKDSKGRDKPFFNICTAAVNIWYRATDIDRRHIQIVATKSTDWIDSFLATVHLQKWMKKARFGQFLNKWGRTLARYGSAVVKFVENDEGLHIEVVPWQRIIVDPIDFANNPKIEILELTEGQLRERVNTMGYDEEQVDALCAAQKARETKDGQKKDNRADYIKLYEVHGFLPKSHITDKASDEDEYVQQMHVISFVGIRDNGKQDFRDFTLFRGMEPKDPYYITHLIEEDNRTLSIGAVEHLFEAQWMHNHSIKAIKDHLDLASKLIFQTSDPNFVGKNALQAIETGDIMIHEAGAPLTQINNSSHDITQWQNFQMAWKTLGNEITGVSEAMLGAQPKSGTAWRQTEALLQESYSLFEVMTENKGLHIEDMLREWILPHIKRRHLNNKDEIVTTLEQHDIDKIDPLYLKNMTRQAVNKKLKDALIEGRMADVTEEGKQLELAKTENEIRSTLKQLGEKRFFRPDEIDAKTWKEQFKDIEWEVDVYVTNEAKDIQNVMATLNTALKTVVTPGFTENEAAQRIVKKILENTQAMSPLEYGAIPPSPQTQPIDPNQLAINPQQNGGQQPRQPAN